MYAGLGLAFALGFERAILVGCDYALKPQRFGHFYGTPDVEDKFGNPNTRYLSPYSELFDFISSKLDLFVLSPFDTEAHLPIIRYAELTGRRPAYRENVDIISPDNLAILKEAYKLGQLPNPV